MSDTFTKDGKEYKVITDEQGNRIAYNLSTSTSTLLKEPYNQKFGLEWYPVDANNEKLKKDSKAYKKFESDIKKYYQNHPQEKTDDDVDNLRTRYSYTRIQNHICDEVLDGHANSMETAYAYGLVNYPNVSESKLNRGSAINFSKDNINGTEPLEKAKKHFEKSGEKEAYEADQKEFGKPGLAGWNSYPLKDELVKHFEKVKKEQERQGLKAEIRDSKGSTQSDYAVEQERRFMLRKQIKNARETYNKIKEENQKQGKPATAEKTAYDFEKLTDNEILKLHLKENKGR